MAVGHVSTVWDVQRCPLRGLPWPVGGPSARLSLLDSEWPSSPHCVLQRLVHRRRNPYKRQDTPCIVTVTRLTPLSACTHVHARRMLSGGGAARTLSSVAEGTRPSSGCLVRWGRPGCPRCLLGGLLESVTSGPSAASGPAPPRPGARSHVLCEPPEAADPARPGSPQGSHGCGPSGRPPRPIGTPWGLSLCASGGGLAAPGSLCLSQGQHGP